MFSPSERHNHNEINIYYKICISKHTKQKLTEIKEEFNNDGGHLNTPLLATSITTSIRSTLK